MSAKLVGRALETGDLSQTEKLVLIGLADCTNTATGMCYPSADFLSNVAMCSVRHVPRCIAALEAKDLIEVERRPGRSSLYTVFPTPDTKSPQPLTPSQDTPDIPLTQLCQDTPDTAMSDEPERTRTKNTREADVPHHYCRTQSAFVDYPKTECDECTPTVNEQGAML